MKTHLLPLTFLLAATMTACSTTANTNTKPEQPNITGEPIDPSTENQTPQVMSEEDRQKVVKFVEETAKSCFGQDVVCETNVDDYNITTNVSVDGIVDIVNKAYETGNFDDDDPTWEKFEDSFEDFTDKVYEYAKKSAPYTTLSISLFDKKDKSTTLMVAINDDVVYKALGE